LEAGYTRFFYIDVLLARGTWFVPVGRSVFEVGPSLAVRNFHFFGEWASLQDWSAGGAYVGGAARVVSRGPGFVHVQGVAHLGVGLVGFIGETGVEALPDASVGIGLLFGKRG
jgi:hypothetical protein